MEDQSRRIISVMPCTHKTPERDHLRIKVEGSGEESDLEPVSVKILAETRMSALGEPEDPKFKKKSRWMGGSRCVLKK